MGSSIIFLYLHSQNKNSKNPQEAKQIKHQYSIQKKKEREKRKVLHSFEGKKTGATNSHMIRSDGFVLDFNFTAQNELKKNGNGESLIGKERRDFESETKL